MFFDPLQSTGSLYLSLTINLITNAITYAARLGPTPSAVALTESGRCADQNERRSTSEGHF